MSGRKKARLQVFTSLSLGVLDGDLWLSDWRLFDYGEKYESH